MCQFIETIRIEKGRPQNLKYHQSRFDKTVKDYSLNLNLRLESLCCIDKLDDRQIYKCRVVYGNSGYTFNIEEYNRREIKSIKVVYDDFITYKYKFLNRNAINELFLQKAEADDILIVKNNIITDTSYCNVAFLNNESWFTPRSPLLKGTMRDSLLYQRQIIEKDIYINEIEEYSKMALFNAMIDWENKICIPIKDIHC